MSLMPKSTKRLTLPTSMAPDTAAPADNAAPTVPALSREALAALKYNNIKTEIDGIFANEKAKDFNQRLGKLSLLMQQLTPLFADDGPGWRLAEKEEQMRSQISALDLPQSLLPIKAKVAKNWGDEVEKMLLTLAGHRENVATVKEYLLTIANIHKGKNSSTLKLDLQDKMITPHGLQIGGAHWTLSYDAIKPHGKSTAVLILFDDALINTLQQLASSMKKLAPVEETVPLVYSEAKKIYLLLLLLQKSNLLPDYVAPAPAAPAANQSAPTRVIGAKP